MKKYLSQICNLPKIIKVDDFSQNFDFLYQNVYMESENNKNNEFKYVKVRNKQGKR